MLKKFVKIFFYLFLTLSVNACFPLTSNSLKHINVNDTEKQVIKILGSPFSKKVYRNKTFLVYYVHDDFFSIFFNIKKFPFVGFFPFLRTGEEYWVILENDKVIAFGSSRNFNNGLYKSFLSKNITPEVLEF